MNRRKRDDAQWLSEYIDKLFTGARTPTDDSEGQASANGDSEELTELTDVADGLSRVRVKPPVGFEQELATRLFRAEQSAELATDAQASRTPLTADGPRKPRLAAVDWFEVIPPAFRTLIAAAVVGVAIGLAVLTFFLFLGGPKASAADILSHSQSVLTKLARPGKILYRRWLVVYVTTEPDGERRRSDQVIHEWMDGSNKERTAARSYAPDGVLLWAYVSVSEGDDLRPHIYLNESFGREGGAVLNIEPTGRELRQALGRFSPGERELLQTYLDRSYIYHPIVGDQRFNRVVLQASTPENSKIPRTVLSLDTAVIVGGVRAYRVRIVDPLQVRLSWRSRQARLGRVETVRYISQDSYLSLRAEEQVDYEDGRHVSMTWDMAETRIQDRAEGAEDPFDLVVPTGTIVRRHSAVDVLRSYAQALGRAATASPQ